MTKASLIPLFRGIAHLTGNRFGQRLWENAVIAAQFLQGIGAGAEVLTSGEEAVFDRLRHHARRLDRPLCIFDVGANRGQFLKLALDRLRDYPIHIHCFEPGSAAFALLSEAARKLENVTINNIALGRTAGQFQLFYDAEASVFASLTKRKLAHRGRHLRLSETVTVDTLDVYCGARDITGIDLLKIDVEGHELGVLQGGSGMFCHSAVEFVSFEFGDANVDTRTFLKDYFEFFSAHGMRISRITPSGYCHELAAYKESMEQFRVSNFLCYKPDR